MLRLLIDQDLDHVILRGLLLRVPNLDVITAHQVGLSIASDTEVLAWAAEQERIVYPRSTHNALSRDQSYSQSGEGCRCHRRFEAIAHQPSDQ
jgi:hypothetical protein